MWEVIVALPADYGDKGPYYARLSVGNRISWKTKRIAEKHARDWKANNLRDSWAQEC